MRPICPIRPIGPILLLCLLAGCAAAATQTSPQKASAGRDAVQSNENWMVNALDAARERLGLSLIHI